VTGFYFGCWNSLSGDLRDKLYREVFFKLWKNMNMIQGVLAHHTVMESNKAKK
jgi:hypothetical protein